MLDAVNKSSVDHAVYIASPNSPSKNWNNVSLDLFWERRHFSNSFFCWDSPLAVVMIDHDDCVPSSGY